MFYDLGTIIDSAYWVADSKCYKAEITLATGDTAYAPGTTKKVIEATGPVVLTYTLTPMGNDCYADNADNIRMQHLPNGGRS